MDQNNVRQQETGPAHRIHRMFPTVLLYLNPYLAREGVLFSLIMRVKDIDHSVEHPMHPMSWTIFALQLNALHAAPSYEPIL
jgi:hypothetical protein